MATPMPFPGVLDRRLARLVGGVGITHGIVGEDPYVLLSLMVPGIGRARRHGFVVRMRDGAVEAFGAMVEAGTGHAGIASQVRRGVTRPSLAFRDPQEIRRLFGRALNDGIAPIPAGERIVADLLGNAARGPAGVAMLRDFRAAVGARLAKALEAAGFPRHALDGLRAAARMTKLGEAAATLLCADTPDAGKVRDLASTHPYVAEVLLGVPTGHLAILSPRPVAPDLFARSANPEAVMERFRGLTSAELGGDGKNGMHPLQVMRLAARVPLDWIPGDAASWRAFADVASLVPDVARRTGLAFPAIVSSAKGDWPGFLGRCHRAGGGPEGIRCAINDLADARDDLARRIVLPLLARAYTETGEGDGSRDGLTREATRLACAVAYGRKSLPGILEASAAWHRRSGAIAAAMPCGLELVAAWEPLCAPARYGSVEVRPLASAVELADEGARGPGSDGVPGLSHCVGGYVAECLSGSADILSVRRILPDGGYVRLSTAEVAPGFGGELALRQHRGHGNGKPPAEAVEALAAFMGRGGFRGRPPVEERVADWVEARCGYEWTDDALVEAAVSAYAPGLPSGLRGLDAAGLSRAIGIAVPGMRAVAA